MSLLIKALEHHKIPVVNAAINSICRYEDEATSRWLLAQFSHSNDRVKITIAQCFQFLFQEEEAMIYRKYLAVPFLIRLLDNTNPDVQIAAIQALAEAEKFRGVSSLIQHLNDDNQQVVAQVVRALGLIRENMAVEPLLQQLQSPHHSAEVYASLLVALKRLNPNDFSPLLAHFAQGFKPFENITLTQRLQALFSINALKEDAVAINFREILQAIKPLVTQKKMLNEAIILHLIPLLTLQNDKTSHLFLKKLINHPQTNIRYKALRQLYTLKINIFSLALQDPDAKTRNLMLSLLIRDNHSLKDSFLLKLVKVQATRQNAIRLMANSKSKVIAQFLFQMLKK
ncbi:MAG: HEAT repeat domain-containing protein, partial [Methylococcales bacterium]|nr:HEAT repeat domain-containing protein [Methylococcales bacterium]